MDDPAHTLANTLNVSFPGLDGESLLIGLDLEGVCASSGSACMVGSVQPSHVLLAMGVTPALASSTVRFSLGTETTEPDIAHCLRAITNVLARQAQPHRCLMKHTQLVLSFRKNRPPSFAAFARQLRDRRRPAYSAHGHRDFILEKLSRQLLRAANCDVDVAVVWNARLRTTAGLACWRTKTVSLNPKLIDVSPDEVQRTLRHELAHFLAQYRAGRARIAPHGSSGKACRDLGIPARGPLP